MVSQELEDNPISADCGSVETIGISSMFRRYVRKKRIIKTNFLSLDFEHFSSRKTDRSTSYVIYRAPLRVLLDALTVGRARLHFCGL